MLAKNVQDMRTGSRWSLPKGAWTEKAMFWRLPGAAWNSWSCPEGMLSHPGCYLATF